MTSPPSAQTSAPETDAPAAAEIPTITAEETRLSEVTEKGATALIKLLQYEGFVVPVGTEAAAKAIDTISAYVLPLPASQAEANWHGYAALLRLAPDNDTYASKAERYKDAHYRARYASLGKLKKKEDEFSEITWYEHPNTPRYVDTRNFLEVYMGEKAGRVWLRLRLNYTNDSWLFIRNARAKIDGDFVDLPVSDWKRDNDSEIWEWVDVMLNPELRQIAERIANSKETIIRFKGQKYYDTMTVRASDKKAILEMFDAEKALKEKLGSN